MAETCSRKRRNSSLLKEFDKKLKLNDRQQDATAIASDVQTGYLKCISERVKIAPRSRQQNDFKHQCVNRKYWCEKRRTKSKNLQHERGSGNSNHYFLRQNAHTILEQLRNTALMEILKNMDEDMEAQRSSSQSESSAREDSASHEVDESSCTRVSSSPESCLQKDKKLQPVVIEKWNQEEQICLSSSQTTRSPNSFLIDNRSNEPVTVQDNILIQKILSQEISAIQEKRADQIVSIRDKQYDEVSSHPKEQHSCSFKNFSEDDMGWDVLSIYADSAILDSDNEVSDGDNDHEEDVDVHNDHDDDDDDDGDVLSIFADSAILASDSEVNPDDHYDDDDDGKDDVLSIFTESDFSDEPCNLLPFNQAEQNVSHMRQNAEQHASSKQEC